MSATETLRPNAVGDITQFAPTGATYNWQCVDEEVADDNTTYVSQVQLGDTRTDRYNITDPTFADGLTINSVKMYFRARYYSAAYDKGYFGIKSGATESWSNEIALPVGYANYDKTWTTDPNTGVAWTKAAITALQIGIKNYNSGMCCTQVYVEVDYTPIHAITSADAGVGTDVTVSGNPIVTLTGAEIGSGVDSIISQHAALIGSDAGSGVEALSHLLASLVDADSGAGVETLIALVPWLLARFPIIGGSHIIDIVGET